MELRTHRRLVLRDYKLHKILHACWWKVCANVCCLCFIRWKGPDTLRKQGGGDEPCCCSKHSLQEHISCIFKLFKVGSDFGRDGHSNKCVI